MTGLEVVALFLVLALVGVPIAVSMGIASAVYIIAAQIPLSLLAQHMANAVNSYPLLAVPIFIFAGALMNVGGISQRIFDFARAIVGRLPGGLAHVCVLANLIFSGVSGAALADLGALGNIEQKAMTDQGYRDDHAAAITGATATVGPIFPPSIPLIIFGSVAEVSTVKLLISGVVPALVIVVILMILILILARIKKFPRDTERLPARVVGRKFVRAFPALMTPVILLGGLVSGLFSPTEVAAASCAYVLVLGIFVYREIDWKRFVELTRDTVKSTANILFIVSAASIFSVVLTIAQVPDQLKTAMFGISTNPIVLLLLANLLLLIVGMFMETISAILVLTPILLPAMIAAGVNPIHFGLVMVFNLMIGLLTPPVGMSLYLVSIISKVSVQRIVRAMGPYLAALVLSLLLVTLYPPLSTWLPSVLFNRP